MRSNIIFGIVSVVLGMMICGGIYSLADVYPHRAVGVNAAAPPDSEVAGSTARHLPATTSPAAALDCPPDAAFCPSPPPPFGYDSTEIAQLVAPVTARLRIIPAEGREYEREVEVASGVWVVPDSAMSRKEVAP